MARLFPASLVFVLLCLVVSCTTGKKITYLNDNDVGATLSLANEVEEVTDFGFGLTQRDTVEFEDFDGRKVLIMKAIRDEKTGEMVATDEIQAAVVTARFRNVAERNGKIDLAFNVTVPRSMQDSKWQLRLYPDMFIMGDSIRLDHVVITGAGYRKAQLKGYQQYEKFLNSIISDSTVFINMGQLEVFLQRNIPQIYAFKNDSTVVSDEKFYSYYGVSEQQAVDHYTNKFVKNRNERRKTRIDKMYKKYVKAPIITEGIRLDTVMVTSAGDFVYNYVQTINTRPKLKKVDIVLSGDIYEQDKRIYNVPRSEPLTFYISSISSFTNNVERYLTQVIERRVSANTECRIDFEVGKSDIKPELGNNFDEIHAIEKNLASLLQNEEFDIDSIVVRATASPEGDYRSNKSLAQKRSESVSKYFDKFLKRYGDSLKRNVVTYNLDDSYRHSGKPSLKIKFTPRCIPENWEDLCGFILNDTVLTEEEKDVFNKHYLLADPDLRERILQKESFYPYLKQKYYPLLRTVKFDFYLHRRGLVKDTVHTTVLDTTYMRGVQALRDMEYAQALALLRPYEDFNTAVAYMGLDRNANALQILSGMEKTAEVNYLLAIIYARLGETGKAIEHYVQSCRQNKLLIHRGNLDPEISALIKAYELDKMTRQEEEDIE